jgi:hypothetical protein
MPDEVRRRDRLIGLFLLALVLLNPPLLMLFGSGDTVLACRCSTSTSSSRGC